jgi:putative transposase
MGCRKDALINGCFYHVFNKSIAGFEIFRSQDECDRACEIFRFYRTSLPGRSYSGALRLGKAFASDQHGPPRVKVLAYCVMPTHFHLFLEQVSFRGISDFMMQASHSYASYFNTKTGRRGPLWESRFKNVLVGDDSHALHLTRYIHLNPTSAGLVKKPEDWRFSSYREHLLRGDRGSMCEFRHVIDLSPEAVRKFTEDRADYQQSLQVLKRYLLD